MMRAKILLLIILLLPEILPQEQKVSSDKIISLIGKFSSEDPYINGDAVRELSEIGESSVPFLLKALAEGNDNIRLCSVITLEKIAPSGKEAVPLLIKCLSDGNNDIRWISAIALGKYKNDALTAVPELQKLLYDKDADIKWAAYISISKISRSALDISHSLPEITSVFEKKIPELMDELDVPGVSVSIIKDRKIVYNGSFGYSDSDEEIMTAKSTLFEACSMSKPVFAWIVLKLSEEGIIDIDKPLSLYLDEEFTADQTEFSKQITARMVLTHTVGLPNWRRGGEERNAPLPLYSKPGSRFSYSGEGFYYLQRAVEKITGEPLQITAKKIMFDKLGMNSTSFIWTESLDTNISTGHNESGDPLPRSKYLHSNAAYTLYVTAEDFAKFITELMNTDPADYSLSPELRDEMLSHQQRSDIRDVIERPGRNFSLFSYRGLGWAIDSTITGNIVYHSGSNQTGFRCYSQFDPARGSGIVIMTNAVKGSELWRRLIIETGDF